MPAPSKLNRCLLTLVVALSASCVSARHALTTVNDGDSEPIASAPCFTWREIDALNVGVRTMDDLLWSMEHEAAHIAFKIDTQIGLAEDRANDYVGACK